ncbi:hypothetical protein U8335_19855 [Roseiconus lacunae]|uniref:hypothetical protein n=1 Tax=Roseiconus lacunae TaxID=2605694 RepID=UPI00309181AE|nr:hypothetical protein U8335_19855 [Stieleria sp. HD01]
MSSFSLPHWRQFKGDQMLGDSDANCFPIQQLNTSSRIILHEHREHQAAASGFIRSLVDQDMTLLDPIDWCVDSTGNTTIDGSGGFFYFDDDHLASKFL